MLPGLANETAQPLPLHAVRPGGLSAFLESLNPAQAAFLRAQGFAGKTLALLPGESGLAGAVLGLGEDSSPFAFGGLASALPPGTVWAIQPGDFNPDDAALGFLLGAYAYDRLKPRKRPPASQMPPSPSPLISAARWNGSPAPPWPPATPPSPRSAPGRTGRRKPFCFPGKAAKYRRMHRWFHFAAKVYVSIPAVTI